MDYINTIREGKKYRVPYSELGAFLADGGKFASPQDKELAMRIEQSQKPGFLGRIGKDIVAGGAGLARNVGELGLAGVKSIEDLGKMVSQATKQAGMQQMQQQQESPAYSEQGQQLLNKLIPQDYTKQYGPEQPNLMDRIIQGGLAHAPELAGGAALLRSGLPLVSRHFAAAPLRQAARMAAERDIGPINISPELIEDARQFFPNTRAFRRTIDEASQGDYDALFRLQSDLGQISRERARNPFFASERAEGRAGHQTRHELLGEKAQALEEMGHEDIAAVQRQGREQYRRYMQLRPYVRGVIAYGLHQAGVPSYLKKLMWD